MQDLFKIVFAVVDCACLLQDTWRRTS